MPRRPGESSLDYLRRLEEERRKERSNEARKKANEARKKAEEAARKKEEEAARKKAEEAACKKEEGETARKLKRVREELLAVVRAYTADELVLRSQSRHAQMRSAENFLASVLPEVWRATCKAAHSDGSYAVLLTGVPEDDDTRLPAKLFVAAHAGVNGAVAAELLKRVEHVGPETIAEGVDLDDAIQIKTDLEGCNAKVKIKEGIRPGAGGREPIPASVRREVWRRDEGKCVDCGSREKLECDHIIPVSKGGSNTARNIQLRCETCNRRKGATI